MILATRSGGHSAPCSGLSVAFEPFLPCLSDFWGKDQHIEELDEFVRVDEVEHIGLGAFAEDCS